MLLDLAGIFQELRYISQFLKKYFMYVFKTPSSFTDSSLSLFGFFQRVKKCLLYAAWNNSVDERRNLIDCARGNIYASASLRALWRDSNSVNACFQESGFSYGIYAKAVNLTSHSSIFTRFSYSLFWGFQVT